MKSVGVLVLAGVPALLPGDPPGDVLSERAVQPVGARRDHVQEHKGQERSRVRQVPVLTQKCGSVVPQVLLPDDLALVVAEVLVPAALVTCRVVAVQPRDAREQPEEQEELESGHATADDLASRVFVLQGPADEAHHFSDQNRDGRKPATNTIISGRKVKSTQRVLALSCTECQVLCILKL